MSKRLPYHPDYHHNHGKPMSTSDFDTSGLEMGLARGEKVTLCSNIAF